MPIARASGLTLTIGSRSVSRDGAAVDAVGAVGRGFVAFCVVAKTVLEILDVDDTVLCVVFTDVVLLVVGVTTSRDVLDTTVVEGDVELEITVLVLKRLVGKVDVEEGMMEGVVTPVKSPLSPSPGVIFVPPGIGKVICDTLGLVLVSLVSGPSDTEVPFISLSPTSVVLLIACSLKDTVSFILLALLLSRTLSLVLFKSSVMSFFSSPLGGSGVVLPVALTSCCRGGITGLVVEVVVVGGRVREPGGGGGRRVVLDESSPS